MGIFRGFYCLTFAKRHMKWASACGFGHSSFLIISKLWFSWVNTSTTEQEKRACSEVCWNCCRAERKAKEISKDGVIEKWEREGGRVREWREERKQRGRHRCRISDLKTFKHLVIGRHYSVQWRQHTINVPITEQAHHSQSRNLDHLVLMTLADRCSLNPWCVNAQ